MILFCMVDVSIMQNMSEKKLPPLFEILSSKARVKILCLLSKEDELNVSEIAKRAHLNYRNCTKHLKYLTINNILQVKRFGRVRIYKFRTENKKIEALKEKLRELLDIWNEI